MNRNKGKDDNNMKSMTGYGRAEIKTPDRQYTVELKSVNHKYLDITVRMPKAISFLEDNVKKTVSNSISRGKLDITICYQNIAEESKEILINKGLAKRYIDELKEIAAENYLEANLDVTRILQFPDVLVVKPETADGDMIWAELSTCLEDAIENFLLMRQIEGHKMKEDLQKRIQELEIQIEEILPYTTGLIGEYVVKLEERIKEYAKVEEADMTRIAQEIVIYADKISIEEEITRLKSHVEQMKEFLQEEGPIGKKLDFLIQEMNRETNTIGAKSSKLQITNAVIGIKTKLEDIREQIQNIE